MDEGDQERVRFCNHCNGVIAWHALFCDVCGGRVDGGEAPAGKPLEQAPERDLFQAHIRLLHRSRDQAAGLLKRVRRLERQVEGLERAAPGAEARRRLIGLTERVLELDQDWEDLQRAYNRQSEGIEEDLQGRTGELEADIELPQELQEALESEVADFQKRLESAQEHIREVARRADLALARQTGRVLGMAASGKGALAAAVLAGCAALGLGVAAGVAQEVPPVTLGAVLGPPAAALLLLLLIIRVR